MNSKLFTKIIITYLFLTPFFYAKADANIKLHTPISDQQIEKNRKDISTVIKESILLLIGAKHPNNMVHFNPTAIKELQKDQFHYEGFSDYNFIVNRFIRDKNTKKVELGVIVSFTDSLLRRSSISMLLTCRWKKNEIEVLNIKIKQLVPPKLMSVLFIVPENKVPKTLLSAGNHAELMQWLSRNASFDNAHKNTKNAMYYLFAINLDRLKKGSKVELRISKKKEGTEGNTYGGIDIDYNGWHVAIAKINKNTLFNENSFAKLILTSSDHPDTKKYPTRIALFHLAFSTKTIEPITYALPSADAYVYAYNYRNWNRSNRGKYDQLVAGWHPTGGESRAYIRFDLSGTNANKINKAVLKLYHFQTSGNNGVKLGIYRVTSSWNEGSDTYHSGRNETIAPPGDISWMHQPTVAPSPVATFNPGTGMRDWTKVDITSLVKQWLSGTPNYGLVIKPMGHLDRNVGASTYHFASRERDPNLDEPKGENKAPTLILSENNLIGNQNKVNIGTKPSASSSNINTSTNTQIMHLPFFDDFSSGTSKWDLPVGASIKNKNIVWNPGTDFKSLQLNLAIPMENIVVEFDGYAESNGIGVHISNKKNIGYVFILGGWFNTKSGSDIGSNAENRKLVNGKVFTPKKWQHYKIVRNGNILEAFCDGSLLFKRTYTKHFEGYGYLKFNTWNAVIGIDNVHIYRAAGYNKISNTIPKVQTPPFDITGTWHWFDGGTVWISKNGTITSSHGSPATWKATWNGSVYVYTIRWNNDKYIDTLILKGDTLDGHNQNGTHVWGKRENK